MGRVLFNCMMFVTGILASVNLQAQPLCDTTALKLSADAYLYVLEHRDVDRVLAFTPDSILRLVGGSQVLTDRVLQYPLQNELSALSTYRVAIDHGHTQQHAEPETLGWTMYIGLYDNTGHSFTGMVHNLYAQSADGVNWKFIYLPLLSAEEQQRRFPVTGFFWENPSQTSILIRQPIGFQ